LELALKAFRHGFAEPQGVDQRLIGHPLARVSRTPGVEFSAPVKVNRLRVTISSLLRWMEMTLARRVVIHLILTPAKELPALPFTDGPFGGTRGWQTPMRRLSLPTRGRIRTELATRLTPVW